MVGGEVPPYYTIGDAWFYITQHNKLDLQNELLIPTGYLKNI